MVKVNVVVNLLAKVDILGVISVCSFPSLSVVVLTSILNFLINHQELVILIVRLLCRYL